MHSLCEERRELRTDPRGKLICKKLAEEIWPPGRLRGMTDVEGEPERTEAMEESFRKPVIRLVLWSNTLF